MVLVMVNDCTAAGLPNCSSSKTQPQIACGDSLLIDPQHINPRTTLYSLGNTANATTTATDATTNTTTTTVTVPATTTDSDDHINKIFKFSQDVNQSEAKNPLIKDSDLCINSTLYVIVHLTQGGWRRLARILASKKSQQEKIIYTCEKREERA